jgi:oxalate decarboxylase
VDLSGRLFTLPPGLGADGTELLLVFPQGNLSEDGTMLPSEWLAHTPLEVLTKNTSLDQSGFAQI